MILLRLFSYKRRWHFSYWLKRKMTTLDKGFLDSCHLGTKELRDFLDSCHLGTKELRDVGLHLIRVVPTLQGFALPPV